MNYQAGGSFYSQNLRSNFGNQNYYNNSNSKNNELSRKNQVQANNGKKASNQKYGDLEIQTFFNNGSDNSNASSAKDAEIQNHLQYLTDQYMAIFDEVNRYTSGAGGQSGIKKLSEIKTHFKELDTDSEKDYVNFISQLIDITKNEQAINYDYLSYKNNPREMDSKLTQIFSNCKYDILIGIKNADKETIKRLENYVKEKKQSDNNYNRNYENKNNYNAYNNNNSSQPYGFGNSIYADQKSNAYTGKSIYGNQPNYNRKIKVKFIYNGKATIREIEGSEKVEMLNFHALEIKGDTPNSIYRGGEILNIDYVKDLTIEQLFGEKEPVLTIY